MTLKCNFLCYCLHTTLPHTLFQMETLTHEGTKLLQMCLAECVLDYLRQCGHKDRIKLDLEAKTKTLNIAGDEPGGAAWYWTPP